MEPESSSPRLQVPATCHYTKPDKSSPYLPSHFMKINLNIILPSIRLGLPSGSLSSSFPHQNPASTSPLPHTCYMPPSADVKYSTVGLSLSVCSRFGHDQETYYFRVYKYVFSWSNSESNITGSVDSPIQTRWPPGLWVTHESLARTRIIPLIL